MALLAEVSLYLLRAWPHFIELFHEVCPGNALPWAVVTVLGDEQCWCLQEDEEVKVLGDLHLEFLFLSGVWKQVLTHSGVTGSETSGCEYLGGRKK